MKKVLSFLLIIIMALACFASCGETDEELITERIQMFSKALNDGDLETVFSCLDVKTAKTFESTLNFFGGILGGLTGFDFDLSDLFTLGVAMTPEDIIKLEIVSISIIDSENAIATAEIDLVDSEKQIVYFEMVYENDGWYIHDMTDEKIVDTINNSNQQGTNINISQANSVTDGNAIIKYTTNKQAYTGVINSKGEIFYSTHNSTIDWTSIGNGAGFVTESTSDGKKKYTLFNEEGKQTFTADGQSADSVVGYGDGLILVYQNTSTISTEEHSYGVLDSDGKWVKKLTAGAKLPDVSTTTNKFKYIGSGIFYLEAQYYGNSPVWYNYNTNQSISFSNCEVVSDYSNSGVFYCRSTSSYGGRIYHSHSPNSAISTPRYFSLTSSGFISEIASFNYTFDNIIINTEETNMTILDKNTTIEKVYTKFPSNMITSVKFDGDFGLLMLKGADGKTYFTVIDKKCNEKVAPTVCSSASISDGMIVYKTSNDIYGVVDVNGKTIVPENQGYTFISDFACGIAKAESKSGECYLDANGKIITITLPKQ